MFEYVCAKPWGYPHDACYGNALDAAIELDRLHYADCLEKKPNYRDLRSKAEYKRTKSAVYDAATDAAKRGDFESFGHICENVAREWKSYLEGNAVI